MKICARGREEAGMTIMIGYLRHTRALYPLRTLAVSGGRADDCAHDDGCRVAVGENWVRDS